VGLRRGVDWKWGLGVALTIAAFVVAGLYISKHSQHTEGQVDTNRAALVTVCSTLTTLSIVFEQLAVNDRELAANPALPHELRPNIRGRISLYNTAVEAINETNTDCDQIE
jgi:hypothetical protein